MREKVEKVLNEKVRPQLELHNGDLDVLDIEDGVVRIRLLGQCAGCPSAYLTIEQLIFGNGGNSGDPASHSCSGCQR